MAKKIRITGPLSLPAKTARFLVVGRKARLESPAVTKHLPSDAKRVWKKLLANTTVGDDGGSATTYLGTSETQLSVCVLPENCSRHNSPARVHAITKQVKAHGLGKGRTRVWVALDSDDHARAAGCAVARAFPTYSRKSKVTMPTVEISLISEAGGTIDRAIRVRVEQAVESVRLAARLVDMPTSELNTDEFVEEAQAVSRELGTSIRVLRARELEKGGFGGLVSVGHASVKEPALVILSHEPEGATKTIAWVGKGIVYDTGGLSIKGKTFMPGMKCDMGGAAAVLGAFQAIVQGGFDQRLHAILCLAENSVGPDATRPDDIIQLYSGRTVEINNTDAEGRLVLSDGVAYAQHDLGADVIVDLATLTGAQMIATGRRHAAIVSNSESLEQAAVGAGRISGDLVHPLPYCPEFFRGEFRSKVADLKNSVKDRLNAQTSCAGQFIGESLRGFKGQWLHVDLAGPSFVQERGTGFGVGLLLALFAADAAGQSS
tara:strand:- start:150 stop:1619 length:1470 start_codon:yes stop_codon:yes gene_type:complete